MTEDQEIRCAALSLAIDAFGGPSQSSLADHVRQIIQIADAFTSYVGDGTRPLLPERAVVREVVQIRPVVP